MLFWAGCAPPVAPPDADAPQRIVSLAPSLTEILFAIGAGGRVVGRTDVCNHPPAVTNLPVVGGFGRPSLEGLAALRPTHVWYVDLEDQGLPALFARLGWSDERIPCNRLDDIPAAVTTLGARTGCDAAAARLAKTLRDGIAARRAAAARDAAPPSVLVVVWWEPLMTVGRESFIADIVALAGGRLVTAEIARDYFTVSDEWALRQNPEVILCIDGASPGAALARLRAATGWRALDAVARGRVYDAFDLDVLCRPGPRVLAAVDQVRAVLHPERQTDSGK
jgi:iron complex transport system substrate-binding protein